MAIQQSITIDLNLVGDGSTTAFTYSFSKLFGFTFDTPGTLMSPSTIPTSASVLSTASSLPSCTASLDGFGNLVLSFTSAPANGAIGEVVVQLNFASGTLAGTTAAWTSSTSANTTWSLPLNGANSITVGFVVSGTITGGTVLFQVSQDGANWFSIQGSILNAFTILTGWQSGVGSQALQFDVAGFSYFRLLLSSVLVGSGTLTFIMQSMSLPIMQSVVVGQTNGTFLHTTLDDGAGSGLTSNVTAKGTQGTNALAVQQFKDSGRTAINFSIDRIAGVTSEALATFTANKGGSTSSGTSYTVTSGKTLRIQSVFVSILDSTTTTVNGRVRIRAASTVSATSPIFALADIGNFTGTAAAGVGRSVQITIPDGLEIASGQQIGISQILSSTSSTLSVSVIGYEY